MTVSNHYVFIVDDDYAIRDSLSLMLTQEGFIVKAFESAEDFLASYQSKHHGCLITDVNMPKMDGIQLQVALLKRNILLPIIFLTGHGDISMSVKTLKAGAVDFLTKPITREVLMVAVKTAILQFNKAFELNASHLDALSRLNKLTNREREVMMLSIQGNSNKNIARQLNISHRTVEIHKSKIMYKTEAANLLDLARIVNLSEPALVA